MSKSDDLQFATVPANQSWLIPLWDGRDYDEFDDLTTSLARGSDRFKDALRAFEGAIYGSNAVGVRFYVGTELPTRVTVTLAPDTKKQAVAMLDESALFMADDRGVVPWGAIRSHLLAIRNATTKSETQYPSFGFSAIIPCDLQYTEASTGWLAKH